MMNLSDWQPTVRWSRDPKDRQGTDLVVFLHGFGADENDLFSLSMAFPENFTVASIQAPKKLPAPFMGGYCWFPISEEMDSAPEDVVESVKATDAWIQEHRTGFRTVSLLGFSQGMAMATSLMRLRPADYAAIIGLSGFVIDASEQPLLTDLFANDNKVAEAQPKLFWGRDINDPIIPNAVVDYTTEWLKGKVDVTAKTYPGVGHGIHPDELSDLAAYLNEAVK